MKSKQSASPLGIRAPRWLRDQRGQALIETGLVLSFLILTCIGIVDFGRAFMISNVLTHALRDGARQAAAVPPSQRDSDGYIADTSAITDRVKEIMNQVVDASTVDSLNLSVTQQSENGVNTVRVSCEGSIPYTFQLVGASFNVNRSVSFRDEGR